MHNANRHNQSSAHGNRSSNSNVGGGKIASHHQSHRMAPYPSRPHQDSQPQQTSAPTNSDSNHKQPSAEEEAEFSKISAACSRMLAALESEERHTYTNNVNNYERIQKIGQGTFGEVFKARCKKTGVLVALKKVLMENERDGFPITALREVKMLKKLKHRHITELIEICSEKKKEKMTFYLVFTFCNYDLAGLLSNSKVQLKLVHQKTLMKHLLLGLFQVHRCKILHRDMKAANILISADGVLKLADFGLARPFTDPSVKASYTNRVVTLWYRPPELLLGERNYTTAIDLWGAGCIMAELWTRTPVMQGETEQRQLSLITRLCGSIDVKDWPEVQNLPLFGKFPMETNKRRIQERLGNIITNSDAMWLLEKLLTLNPAHRPDTETALDADFFFKPPLPEEDVRDLIKSLNNESMFEYTTGRGAHQNRAKLLNQQQNGGRPSIAPVKNNEYTEPIF